MESERGGFGHPPVKAKKKEKKAKKETGTGAVGLGFRVCMYVSMTIYTCISMCCLLHLFFFRGRGEAKG